MKGLGYKPDAPDARDHRYGANSGPALAPLVLDEPDQERFVRTVRDQGGTSSCVGQALAAAIEICAAIAGQACEISASGCYVFGVEAERPTYRGALDDDGSFPRLVMAAAQTRGVLPESARPFSEENVVKRPVHGELLEAFDARGLRYFRIDATGKARIDAIKDALRRGYGLLFGTNVSAEYQRNRGEVVTAMGPSIGGHMQAIVAVRGDTVRILNSWGEDWGDLGFANFSAACFAELPISDLYAVTWVPNVDHVS